MANTVAVKFGIKPKLFLLVLMITVSIIAIILVNINRQSKASARETVSRSLDQSADILATALQKQFNSIEETVVSLSKDGRIRPLIYEQDSPTLQDLSLEYERTLEFSSMLITDAEGFILARSDRPEAIGYALAGRSELFDKPLSGSHASGFIASGGKIFQMVSVPVFDNTVKDVVRGIIALSYELSPAMANEINRATHSEVSFYSFTYNAERQIDGIQNIYATNKKVSEDLTALLGKETIWQSYIKLKESEKDRELLVAGERYRLLVTPIARHANENLGFIVTYRSETELLKPFKAIEQQVLVVGSVCVILALFLSWLLATRISSPIVSLVSLTKAIENEKYPEVSECYRSDEIGVLQAALEKMGRGIRDKNELEGYLAAIADDFGEENDFIRQEISASEKQTEFNAEIDAEMEATVVSDFSPQKKMVVANSLFVGSVIDGRYELLKKLGEGATGIAFLAHDTALDEDIAIKFLFSEYVNSESAIAFKEEIKLARKITHKNIMRTFDFGSTGENYYITMEYVQGYDLRELIDMKGALSAHMTVLMAKQICSALASAHESGIIHRDLKPQNMIISRRGILKIMDFGLAMRVGKLGANDFDDLGQSQQTTVAGTPKYMAPEQFVSTTGLDQRSDIYSVGVILYTLLMGKTPFNGKTVEDIAAEHFHEPVPKLDIVASAVYQALEVVIHKAMAKDKNDRYQSVGEMLDAINAIEV